MLGLASFKSLVFVVSTESFRWLLLVATCRVLDFFFLATLYLLSTFLVAGPAREGTWASLRLVVLFFRVPVTVNFFVKYYALASVGSLFPGSLLALLLFPLSVLAVGYLVLALTLRSEFRMSSSGGYGSLGLVLVLLLVPGILQIVSCSDTAVVACPAGSPASLGHKI